MPQTTLSYKTRTYDIIAFGDELPGILSLICAAREYYRRTNQYPRSLLMFKGDSRLGVGGHLVRGGLSYLDRSLIYSSKNSQSIQFTIFWRRTCYLRRIFAKSWSSAGCFRSNTSR